MPPTHDDAAPVSIRFTRGTVPTTRTVLQTLPKARLLDLGRTFGAAVPSPASATKEAQAEALAASNLVRFRELLGTLGRDELKAACRAHGLDDAGRARPALAARLLQAPYSGGSIVPPTERWNRS